MTKESDAEDSASPKGIEGMPRCENLHQNLRCAMKQWPSSKRSYP